MKSLFAQLEQVVSLAPADYIRARDRLLASGEIAKETLESILDAPQSKQRQATAGMRLCVRAWIRWSSFAPEFRRILERLGRADEIVAEFQAVGAPMTGYWADMLAAYDAEMLQPLLGEALFKTGASWSPWVREAAVRAIVARPTELAATTLLELAVSSGHHHERAILWMALDQVGLFEFSRREGERYRGLVDKHVADELEAMMDHLERVSRLPTPTPAPPEVS